MLLLFYAGEKEFGGLAHLFSLLKELLHLFVEHPDMGREWPGIQTVIDILWPAALDIAAPASPARSSEGKRAEAANPDCGARKALSNLLYEVMGSGCDVGCEPYEGVV